MCYDNMSIEAVNESFAIVCISFAIMRVIFQYSRQYLLLFSHLSANKSWKKMPIQHSFLYIFMSYREMCVCWLFSFLFLFISLIHISFHIYSWFNVEDWERTVKNQNAWFYSRSYSNSETMECSWFDSYKMATLCLQTLLYIFLLWMCFSYVYSTWLVFRNDGQVNEYTGIIVAGFRMAAQF